jgi:ABC-2 type transport system permease protein
MLENLRFQLSAAGAVVQRDFAIFVSYRARTLAMLANVGLSVTLFYYISRLVDVPSFDTPADYFAFVVIGLIISQVLQSTLGVALQLRSELVAGTFERVLMSPFGVVGGVVSMMIFPFLTSVCLAVAMLVISVAGFGMPIESGTALLALPVCFLGALSFAGFGVLFAALAVVFKQATGVQWVVALVSLVGGLYFPVALFPDWIQWTSEVQPFTPTVDLLRHLLSGHPMQGPAAEAVIKLVGFAGVLIPLSMLALGAAARRARRRGTIIEY